MIIKEEIWLGKAQADPAVAEVLSASDYLHCIPGDASSIDVIPAMEEILQTGDNFENSEQIVSTVNTNVKITQYMQSLGNINKPAFINTLECSGFDIATTVVNAGTKEKYVATPGYTSKNMSLEWYRVNTATNALKTNAHNVVLAPKFIFDGSKVPRVEFNGIGCYGSESVVLYAALPSVTRNSVAPVAFNGVTWDFFGMSGKCSKMDIDCGVTAEQTIDWSTAYGFGTSDLSGRKIKVSATIYTLLSDTLPLTTILALTQDGISFAWGPTGNKIAFVITTGQMVARKSSKVGKYQAWDVEIMVLNNGMTITVNNDLT